MAPQTGRTGRDALLRRWVLVVTAGELAGFALPAIVGPLTSTQPPSVSYPALVAAGLVEGAVLGWAQWTVARQRLPDLSQCRWVGLTSVGAAAAYAIALLAPIYWDALSAWPIAVQITVFALGGTLLLLTIGTAQWLELRHHVTRAWRWIAVTALAWCVALSVFFAIATPLWQEGQALWLTVLIGAIAGLAMALTMAAVTGWGFLRMTRRAP